MTNYLINVIRNLIGNNRKVLTTIISFISILCIWYVIGDVLGNRTLSSPTLVAEFTTDLIISGDWVPHASVTIGRMLVAFTFSMLFGILFAFFLGFTSFWEAVFRDYIVIWLAMPGLLFIIFAAMWFGTGNLTPIVAGTILAFPYTAQIVYEDVKDIDRDLLIMGQSFGVSRLRITRWVILQSVFPAIFVAARLAFAGLWTVVTLAEYIASSSGLGFQLRLQLQAVSMVGLIGWAMVFVFIIGFVEYGIFHTLEKRVFAYRQDELGGPAGV